MNTYKVEIKGLTPYLMNRFDESLLDEPKRKITPQALEKKMLEKKFYRNKGGKLYIPSTQIIGCLVNAGKEFKLKGTSRATYSKKFGASLSVVGDEIVMTKQKYNIFRISGVNPNTGGRVMISRPRFEEWGLKFVLSCDDDDIKEEVIKPALVLGGKSVGIGDWRPDKKGRFGKFKVVIFRCGGV